jgi:pimeloyl-ACP methyl ester carboxylesterase
MKQRAGTVGKSGVAPLIDELANQVEGIHLVGHSFGGRVVTAAAANSTTKKLFSMSLLQAAFSQNGFSKRRQGFFRSVIDNQRVAGPILVTNTKKDLSVGLAYPAASRISGDAASAFGGADDPFGGIGSNGAQQMEDHEISGLAARLESVNFAYKWEVGCIHNLKDDRFIVDPKGGDAHGFVFVPEVAWAISRAVVA